MPRSPRRTAPQRNRNRTLVALAALVIVEPGCGSVKQSQTARTGTEQLLLTNAWDRALQKVDFRPLTGVPVFLDVSNVTAVDQGWVVSSIREALLTNGVLLRPKVELAQFVVEARVGAYGTDESNWMLGVPQVTVPPTVTGVPTGTIPEMPFVKKADQSGKVKLALFAYDRAGGGLVWSSGTQVDTSTVTDRYVGGFGPIRSGTMVDGAEIDGIPVPLGGASTEPGDVAGSKPRWWQKKKKVNPARSAPPTPLAPSTAPMAAKSDLDSFRP